VSPAAEIERLHRADVEAARALLREAIRTAGERWLPADAIADALIEELVAYAGGLEASRRTAAYLRGVAALVERGAPMPARS